MKYLTIIVVTGLLLAVTAPAGATTFATGVDSMNYTITTWSIRTDYAGAWKGITPTHFKYKSGWSTRYDTTGLLPAAVTYTQALSGTAVITDVFSHADLVACATPAPNPGWASMGGPSSPISFWLHGGQFFEQTGGNDASYMDDTYWASNEYGSPRTGAGTASLVVTEFTGTFNWDGSGPNGVVGKVLADDWAQVYLNGTLIYTTDSRAYDAVESFSYLGELTPGTNYLKIILHDTGQGSTSTSPTAGATALQLEMDIIPEPVTILGVLMGVGGAAGYLRRRRKA